MAASSRSAANTKIFYDPDFCIYNEVFVHDGQGNFEIFGYPEEVFPPTDFHSATLVGGHIYIIGCMGYDWQRVFGHTPVYRLNIKTLVIELVQTLGDSPGWICRRQASLKGKEIHLTGGQTWRGEEDNDRRPQGDAPESDPEGEDEELDELILQDFEARLSDDESHYELDESDIERLMERFEEEGAEAIEPTSIFILDLTTLVLREVAPEQSVDWCSAPHSAALAPTNRNMPRDIGFHLETRQVPSNCENSSENEF